MSSSDNEIRTRLRSWADGKGLSGAAVARKLGISPGAYSQYLANKYGGDNAKIAANAEDLLKREAERAESPTARIAPGWKPTSVAMSVYALMDQTHQSRTIGLVTGDAGVGKTETRLHYVAEHRAAVSIHCLQTWERPVHVLKAVGDALGIRVPAGMFDATKAVHEALKNTDRLLVFDEVQRVSLKSLEVIRDIWDVTSVGIVLCGNYAVSAAIYGDGTAAFAQHFSRLGGHVHVTNEQITAEDIDLVMGEALEAGDRDSRLYLLEISRRGGFRTALHTLKKACALRTSGVLPEGEPMVKALRSAHQVRGFGQHGG